MTNNIELLNICLEDSLFAALYEALCHLETKWHTSSPVDMWIEALSARQKLSKSRRPDLLLRQLFAGSNPNETVVVERANGDLSTKYIIRRAGKLLQQLLTLTHKRRN